MKSNLTPLVLAFAAAGLSACGGGSSSDAVVTTKAITYSVNFTLAERDSGLLCADENQNLACDAAETQVEITANTATLTSEDVAILNSQYILTKDNKLQLSAPAAVADGATIVMSEATTLVVANMLGGQAQEQAVESVVETLNKVFSLSIDATTLLTEEQSDLASFNTEFVKLWNEAQSQTSNIAALLSGFSAQLTDIATAITDETHMAKVEEFVDNALHWDRGYPMTDTGVTLFATNDSFDGETAIAEFSGQDADYGLDVNQNDNTDGAAGFRYQKLDASGEVLAADAQEWQCVQDLETGFIWEVKQMGDGPRHKDSLFVHQPDSTRDIYDAEIEEASCENADGVCSVQDYEIHLNELNDGAGLCGSTAWKVPSFNQLYSLVHFGSIVVNENDERLGIDTTYFPATYAGDFWTSSASVENYASLYYDPHMWTIGFNDSYIGATYSYDFCIVEEDCYASALPVRLVTVGEKE